MSGQQNPKDPKIRALSQALRNAADQLASFEETGVGSTPPSQALTYRNTHYHVSGTGLPAGGGSNPWGYGYTGPAGGYPGYMGYTGYMGPAGGGYTGPPHGMQDQPVSQSTVNKMAQTQVFMASENSARINEITKWAVTQGFKEKRPVTSFEGLDPDFNSVQAHETKNFITNSTPYEIKTPEGKRAYDEFKARPTGVLSASQVENAALAMAKYADEDQQERDKKRTKVLSHAPAPPSRDDCLKVFKEMTDHQKAIEPASAEVLQWAKDLLLINKGVRKLKPDQFNAFTENSKIFGLVYFFKKTAINPFKLASEDDKTKFKEYKNMYDLCLDDEWNGDLADCAIPEPSPP